MGRGNVSLLLVYGLKGLALDLMEEDEYDDGVALVRGNEDDGEEKEMLPTEGEPALYSS